MQTPSLTPSWRHAVPIQQYVSAMQSACVVHGPMILPHLLAMVQTKPAPPSPQSALVLQGSGMGSRMTPPESLVAPPGPASPMPMPVPPAPVKVPVLVLIVPVLPPDPPVGRSCCSLEQAAKAATASSTLVGTTFVIRTPFESNLLPQSWHRQIAIGRFGADPTQMTARPPQSPRHTKRAATPWPASLRNTEKSAVWSG